MSSVLSVRGAVKGFARRQALDGVGFELAADTITVLLGENGAGKSTLLRAVLGVERLDRGSIAVLGLDPLTSAAEARRSIGYLHDQPDACSWMTTRELCRFLRPEYPSWSDERAGALIERMSVPADAPIGSLSRGQAAMAMLAVALAHEPRLVLLDEPSSRLDPRSREILLSALLEYAPAPGGAVLIATHDLDLAARVADRVIVLAGGRVAADVDLTDGDGPIVERLRALYGPAAEATS